jgi:Fur family peroxide stress response transcriptional regulator
MNTTMNYLELLKQNKLKITPQRSVILQQINKSGHIDIDTLYAYVKNQFPNISLATLYKNINAMLEKTILKEVKITGIKTKYEITKDEHIHTICNNCGKVEDLFIDTKNINQAIQNQSDFIIDKCDMNFFGICKDCQN